MKRLLMVVPAAFLFIGSGAIAAPTGGTPVSGMIGTNFGSAGDHGNQVRKQHAIFTLLKKGKQIQIADGGMLTDAHHAQLQREFEAIKAGNY